MAEEQQQQVPVMNLEETSFFDLSQIQGYYQNLKQLRKNSVCEHSQENIGWKLIKRQKFFNYETIKVPKIETDKYFQQFINYFKSRLFHVDPQNPLVKIRPSTKVDAIKKFAKKGYIKAILCGVYAEKLLNDSKFNGYFEKLIAQVQKCEYPLALAELGMQFQQQKQLEIAQKYYERAITYCQPAAFILYSMLFAEKEQYHKSYEMLRNAEYHKALPSATSRLAQAFVANSHNKFPCSLFISKRYLDRVDPKYYANQGHFKSLAYRINEQVYKLQNAAKNIETTLQTQARSVADFIKQAFSQKKTFSEILIKNRRDLSINFYTSSKNDQIPINQKKVFYVVFPPLLLRLNREFLVIDKKGKIQTIVIAQWQKIPKQKLQLLHKLGTKIILKSYIRRYSQHHRYPIYFIFNPFEIQIIPNQQRHCISDQKYRQCAKQLYKNKMYKEAMLIYQHLKTKGSKNMQIIYCNMGLICQKFDNLKEAKMYYQQSLATKKNLKAFVRILYIFLQQEGDINTCLDILQYVDDESQRAKALKAISKYQKIKKRQVTQTLIVCTKFDKNIQFRESSDIADKFFYMKLKYCVCQLLGIDAKLHNSKYLSDLKKILDIKGFKLTKDLDLKRLSQYFRFCYYIFQVNTQNSEAEYQQSFGYFWYYSNRPLSHNNLQSIANDVCRIESLKCNFLQKSINDYFYYLEIRGKYQEVIKIIEAMEDKCLPFCRKKSDIYQKLNNHQENYTYCSKMLNNLLNKTQIQKFFKTILYLSNQQIKSLLFLKKYQLAIQHGQQILNIIEERNQQLVNYRLIYQHKKQIYQQKSCIVQEHLYEQYYLIKNSIAKALFFSGNLHRSLQYLNLSEVQTNVKSQRFILSCRLLKAMILCYMYRHQNERKKELSELIHSSLEYIEQIDNKNLNVEFRPRFLKCSIDILLQERDYQQLALRCKWIVTYVPKQVPFIIERLSSCLYFNQQHILSLEKVFKNYIQLNIILEDVNQKLKPCFQQKIKDKVNKIRKIQQTIKLMEQIEGKQQSLDLISLESSQLEYELSQQIQDQNIPTQLQSQYPNYFKLEQQKTALFNQLVLDYDNNYAYQYEGYVYNNHFSKQGAIYYVYFKKDILYQGNQFQHFSVASGKICGDDGIEGVQILPKATIRLKTRISVNLIGNLIRFREQQYHLFFSKKQQQDNSKNQNN